MKNFSGSRPLRGWSGDEISHSLPAVMVPENQVGLCAPIRKESFSVRKRILVRVSDRLERDLLHDTRMLGISPSAIGNVRIFTRKGAKKYKASLLSEPIQDSRSQKQVTHLARYHHYRA